MKIPHISPDVVSSLNSAIDSVNKGIGAIEKGLGKIVKGKSRLFGRMVGLVQDHGLSKMRAAMRIVSWNNFEESLSKEFGADVADMALRRWDDGKGYKKLRNRKVSLSGEKAKVRELASDLSDELFSQKLKGLADILTSDLPEDLSEKLKDKSQSKAVAILMDQLMFGEKNMKFEEAFETACKKIFGDQKNIDGDKEDLGKEIHDEKDVDTDDQTQSTSRPETVEDLRSSQDDLKIPENSEMAMALDDGNSSVDAKNMEDIVQLFKDTYALDENGLKNLTQYFKDNYTVTENAETEYNSLDEEMEPDMQHPSTQSAAFESDRKGPDTSHGSHGNR